jgi:hypothetical protein
VDRIPLPDDHELADAARRAQIITDGSQAVAIGHAIIVRADSCRDFSLGSFEEEARNLAREICASGKTATLPV